MDSAHRRLIGVLGGMGPEATIWLMRRILAMTPATDDSDHVPLLVSNNTQVPSRIKAIIDGHGDDPAPVLQAMARTLETGGALALAMPCNTAHFYATSIQRSVCIPLLNMLELTASHIASMVGPLDDRPIRRVGMLASPAVRLTGVFDVPFQSVGIETIYPDDDSRLLTCIKAVKAGTSNSTTISCLDGVIAALADNGADIVLVACSELSMLKDSFAVPLPLVDSIDVLARAVVSFSLDGRLPT